MARVPESVLEQLKAKVSVERLAEGAGVVLKPHGKDRIGLCPFHDDREPSLVITPGKNLWHCLGACQAGGTVIDWVMKAEGVSFRHAVELLQNDYAPESSALAAGCAPVRQASVPKLSTPLARGAARSATGYRCRTARPVPRFAGSCSGSGSCARPGTSTSTARW